MSRQSYRLLAFVLVLAFVFGTVAAMAPATAEASGMGGHPPKHHMAKNNPNFSPDQLPNPFVRDFDGDCEWWRYELRGGRYVRVYCPCKYGDAEISYRRDVRTLWAQYDFSQGFGPAK